MKVNDILYGFAVTNIESTPDVCGVLYTMEHKKTGAILSYLKRDDKNKTFAIAFRTPPEDSTGVFHIIEHSVLCGSEKYPVKEPFVELLKGSLNTFLNALTYEDRTVYPVASRCEKDFLNLTDVYLDAVFHPRMLKDKFVFLQEGWHYEYDEKADELSINGVVYNEMCGAYSSPDEVADNVLRASLFPNSVYRHDSGGNPDSIPGLTYEQLKAAHGKYYHPSNSMIFLDGDIDLHKALPLIASYLDSYDKLDISIDFPKEAPISPGEIKVEFEPSGDPLARVLFGYVCHGADTKSAEYALSILDTAIAQTNESALKKAMLEGGLCEDVATSVYRANQLQYTIELFGVKEEDIPKAAEALERAIRDIAESGVDRETLNAALGNAEFKLKENGGGSNPIGVTNALAAFSFQNYGLPVSAAFNYSDDIEFSRNMVGTDYYERLLLSCTVDNPHSARVVMLPREDHSARLDKEKRARLDEIKASLTKAELEGIISEAKMLEQMQSAEDSPEAVATLPKLSISDIEQIGELRSDEVRDILGVKTVSHNIECGDITYLALCFDLNDLSDEELFAAYFMGSLFKNLPTRSHSVASLQNDIKSSLGSLSFGISSFPSTDGKGDATLTFIARASSLKRNKNEILRLAEEILLSSDFSRTDIIEKQLIQHRSIAEEMLTGESIGIAITRASSSTTRSGRISELTTGYTAYKHLCELCKDVKSSAATLSQLLSKFVDRFFVQKRLIISHGSAVDEELFEAIAKAFPMGEAPKEVKSFESGRSECAIAVPARVCHAAVSAISEKASGAIGALRVARSILSYEYLWNEIRVKGGAYGTGFSIRKSGEMSLYSFRDPSPSQSLDIFRGASDYLKDLAQSDEDLTKFIIGAYGEYDALFTPRTESIQAFYDYMTGWSTDRERAVRTEILTLTKKELARAAEIISEALFSPSVCVIGDKATLEKLSPAIEIIEKG